MSASAPPFAIAVAVAAGVFLVTQNGINTALKEASGMPAVVTAFFSFSVYLTDQLGFAVFTICMILGQILISLLCDVTGFLSDARRIPSKQRLLALVGVFTGAGFISADNFAAGSSLTVKSPALVAVLLIGAVVTGSGMPVQALLNGVMTKHLGTPFRASAVSFAGGALVLGFLSLLNDASAFGEIDLSVISPWMWMGGLCGALAITGNIIGVAQLGAAAYSAIFVATQLLAALLFDKLGAFGFEPVNPSTSRLVGVFLAASSAVAYQIAPSTLEPKAQVQAKTLF